MGTNALRLLKQIELLYSEKHLPGRHNQKMHAPLKYLRGSGKVNIAYRNQAYVSGRWEYIDTTDTSELKAKMRIAHLSENDIQRMVSVKGLNADVKIQQNIDEMMGGSGFRLKVRYTDSNGNYAGSMERSYGYNEFDNELVAHNDVLQLSSRTSMGGIASTLYANQIMTLRERGYDRIDTYADISVGRYAWARKGFDYATENGLDYARRQFGSFVRSHSIVPPKGGWPEFNHAKEFADFTIPGVKIPRSELTWDKSVDEDIKGSEFEVGKAFMLDDGNWGHGAWEATLRLQE